MAVVVVDEGQLGVIELTAPLDGLGSGADGCYRAVGGVGIGGGDVAGGTEYFAHVLGEVKAVCVPCAVLLDGQRTGGYGLRRIPVDEPKPRVVAAGEVNAGNLQITTVQIALVQCYSAVGGYLLEAAAAHAVVCAGNHGAGGFVGEADGAVFCVVDSSPDACLCLDDGLITIRIENGEGQAQSVWKPHIRPPSEPPLHSTSTRSR